MLFEIFQIFSLGHVVGVLLKVAEPLVAVLPVDVPGCRHVFSLYCDLPWAKSGTASPIGGAGSPIARVKKSRSCRPSFLPIET